MAACPPRRAGRCFTKCALRARPPRTRPDNSPNSSARTRSAPTTPKAAPSAFSMPRCAGSNSLVMRAADLNKLPAGSALAVDREGFAAAITAALEAEPLIEIDRAEVVRPPAEWDSVIVATGPLTSPALAETIRSSHRRRRAVVFRRYRAHRPPRLDRLWCRVVSVALRQGRTCRLGRRLHQLPADARAIRRLRRCAACRRQSCLPRFRDDDAIFRWLPADRSDGRARTAKRCAMGR